jgi:hypothetical protein
MVEIQQKYNVYKSVPRFTLYFLKGDICFVKHVQQQFLCVILFLSSARAPELTYRRLVKGKKR